MKPGSEVWRTGRHVTGCWEEKEGTEHHADGPSQVHHLQVYRGSPGRLLEMAAECKAVAPRGTRKGSGSIRKRRGPNTTPLGRQVMRTLSRPVREGSYRQ